MMKAKPLNKILAHIGSLPTLPRGATLWELPDQGVYLTHPDSTSFIRVCSKADFDQNSDVLKKQGWTLEEAR